ncbi:MAG: ABC transporter ATP-binding protein [Pseudomonadota bacterium]
MKDLGRMDAPFIAIQNLSRCFVQGERRQQVLDGVSFTLHRGETVALLGRSGSGKSTLLNLLSGIDLPDSGDVNIDGTSMLALTEQQRTLFRRQHIGFIYQFFNLIPSLTVAENIALVLELNGMATAAALARAEDALKDIGLGDKAEQYPARLSGGEQQRVAILRALVHAPKLVLADEPTGNLDAVTGRQMLQVLRDRLQQAESTTLIVTHSLSVAQSADRILTMENGLVTERSGDFAW